MSKPIKKYDRAHVGYYVNYVVENNTQPFQIVGTYAENFTENPNSSYINDEWFSYITAETHNPRPIISGNVLINALNNVSRIDDYIIKNFSCRYVFSDDFCTWVDYDFKPADTLTISAPLIFQKIARSKVRSLFENKREEYKRLWEMQTSVYNPLNDFDNYEKETHKGTDTTAHSGTDTTANTGTDTTAHSGKDTTQNTGTDTTTRTGSESNAHSGTNGIANTGTDTNNGYTYAFDSVNDVQKDKNTTTYGKSETTTFNDTVTTTYNSVADATAHGLKTELTHGESIATTHGKSTSITHGESIGLTHGEIIEKELHGSTMSPAELLTEHRKMWEDFNFLGIVATDVIKEISV